MIQRDLEDQILEEVLEHRKQTKTNNMATEQKRIKPADVLALLKSGYTRYRKDDAGFGNLQDHYSLTGVEVKRLCQHDLLKKKKTVFPGFVIDEDESEEAVGVEDSSIKEQEDDLYA